jgi:hypothetical protein
MSGILIKMQLKTTEIHFLPNRKVLRKNQKKRGSVGEDVEGSEPS